MKWLWTWSGICFGYRDGDNLWTYDGKHVGRFFDEEVYGCDGKYLGEIMNEKFLITNTAKRNWKKGTTSVHGRRVTFTKYADYTGYAMYLGHEDFRSPKEF